MPSRNFVISDLVIPLSFVRLEFVIQFKAPAGFKPTSPESNPPAVTQKTINSPIPRSSGAAIFANSELEGFYGAEDQG
jgi:hypothetical protein